MKFISAINKKTVSILLGIGLGALAFAYNPPVQGENLASFINPNQMTIGNSTAGGPLLTITPSSVFVNPALGSYQNRITFDFGYTGIITSDQSVPYEQAFGTGILIPTDWCNITTEIFGIFADSEKMQLGNTLNFKGTLSKEVMENLSIGVGIGTGYFWGYNTDWNLVLDIGAVYKWGELGPMKNFRIGASILNLGKVYNNNYTMGIKRRNDGSEWSTFPSFMTVKAGAAAEFVNTQNFTLGLSVDVSTMFFSNIVFDAGVQMNIYDIVYINSGWQFDIQAAAMGYQNWIPIIGIAFKFGLDTSFTNKKNWSKSDMSVASAWKQVAGDVNAISLGAVVNLGQQDRSAPVITIDLDFDDEDEE